MKKITLLMIASVAFSITSCKKDRVCECTNTYTSSSGNVITDPNANVTYIDSKKRDAKDHCQKSTRANVNGSGGTSTSVYDCKLK